ncbi:MAG: hypothetical protein KF805_08990 [Phycisphaeraceae bacterium]|nr:hypothetical protein [Phycisphaeraceae bacterium]
MADLRNQPSSERQKWADALVYTHFQLGHAELAVGVLRIELQVFDSAAKFVCSMITTTKSRCPADASDLAVAIVEAVLQHELCETDKPLQCVLMRARTSYENWGQHGRCTRRVVELYQSMVKCVRQQNWKLTGENASHFSAALAFRCPLGNTLLVFTVRGTDSIEMAALDQSEGRTPNIELVRGLLASHHPGIRVEQSNGVPGIVLVSELTIGDGPLPTGEFTRAVMLLNDAAECLLALSGPET